MADIWDVMKGVHVPGPNALYVGINGNDANPGTSGSRKRTIEAALNAMPAGGGIIYVGDGDYGSIGLYGRSFSNNAWCLVKSENLWGAKASGGITVSGQCVGIYGFETPQNAIGCADGAYLAVWRCYVHDTGGAGIYAAGNNSDISNVSWCYNLVHDTGWGDAEFAQSNMTAYEFKNNVGSQGHNWVNGYDNLIIGNICHSGFCLAGGDGNGMIIDDMHNQQMGGSVNYNGNWLMMGNLMVDNVGVGLHILQSDNVDTCFNTSYHNSNGMDGNAGAIGAGGADHLHYWANLLHNVPWFNGYQLTNFQYDANVYLAGVDGGGGWDDTPMPNQRNRTSDGLNYFTNNNPTLDPDLTTAAQYVPDGGAGAIETYTISQAQYDKWATFPDLFGNYRPSNRVWTVGFAGAGGGVSPGPVAAFTVSDATPDQGQSVTFTDQSTGSPTSWSWNFGDGATSTLRNPSHAWSTTGSKTVTLTVSNTLGSSQVSHTYTVGGVVSGPGTISHPALGVHGHLLSSSSDGTTAGGKPRYKITYQMTSISGAIITATAVAAFPGAIGSPPAGGWPIILAGHGATGTNDDAAPSGWSDDMSNAVGNVDTWLNAGYIVVQADYEGLNPNGDSLPHPYMVGVSAARSLLDAGLACAGLTTVKASGAAVGFSQGGHAALFAAEYQASYAPQYVQFCSVGFDPVITSDYVDSIYNGQYSDEYLASIIYGQWIENPGLSLTAVVSAGAAADMPNLETWDFGTTAANINFGSGSFTANPVTTGGGWSTAIYNNTPGHRLARPSRVYSPSGGIGGGDTWLSYALGSGTTASRETGGGGHQIINVSGAVSWVTSTLASQTGTAAPVAAFSFAPPSPQVNDTVYFTDESQNAPTSWVWNFGDGATSTSQNPSHAWSTPGTKTVTLTVTNAQGSNQTSRQVTVGVAGPPVVNFTMVPSPGTAGQAVQFTDTSSGSPTSWAWTFGD